MLPKIESMRPALIDKLEKLIADGAIVVGPAPKYSPSLQNQPWSDKHVSKIASKIWGNVDGINVKSGKYGKGYIYDGVDLNYVMSQINCIPDCYIPEKEPLTYSHRTDNGTEIYYISNPSDNKITTDITFRVKGKQPELWTPITGNVRHLAAFTPKEEKLLYLLLWKGEKVSLLYFVIRVHQMDLQWI